MAGVDCPNLVTKLQGTPRDAEVPLADWHGGMNKGASNTNVVGLNTGDKNPKEQDWERVFLPTCVSQIIGTPPNQIAVALIASDGSDHFCGFGSASVDTLPDETYAFGTLTNRTCQTLFGSPPDWAFGEGPVMLLAQWDPGLTNPVDPGFVNQPAMHEA